MKKRLQATYRHAVRPVPQTILPNRPRDKAMLYKFETTVNMPPNSSGEAGNGRPNKSPSLAQCRSQTHPA
ncbi:hypothetical protein CH63R_14380 [Colletotrichum higginsianum IMI 349063]|uniref:Uncharacterized protein n=1 Tax=Colletotrichum higginsianum (strain IMI 349063) TaxID=759273 RepID=A0A1B7XTV4_COLHI|nr:hypothetical protein CH63R_14380 [Colletotrichum higginsianum IMI 349063]OBR03154.1 hypothetical protein CH63R_14380 [Colletotrichum higginsianum IMI 349063]